MRYQSFSLAADLWYWCRHWKQRHFFINNNNRITYRQVWHFGQCWCRLIISIWGIYNTDCEKVEILINILSWHTSILGRFISLMVLIRFRPSYDIQNSALRTVQYSKFTVPYVVIRSVTHTDKYEYEIFIKTICTSFCSSMINSRT